MRHRPFALHAVLFALLALARPALAQKNKNEPRRPRLAAGADTNSSQVYYDYGLLMLERDPEQAADAFYWAARLNPASADAYFARRCALLMSDKYRLMKYLRGDRRTIQSDEVKRADSLYLYSLTINPFLYQKLDYQLFEAFIRSVAESYSRNGQVPTTEVEYYLQRELRDAPASFRAWRAYGEGRFDDAQRLYAQAIKEARYKAGLRVDRGRLFFQLDHADSALAELTLAAEEMRKTDKKDIVYVYESKALVEHSIGMVQLRLGNAAAAREAFGRALQEDLSYFPAHVQLGYMALEAKDTTTALSEMDLAVQIREDDPALRYFCGYSLATSAKPKEAEVQLRKAIELDPFFAAPHAVLGQVLAQQGRPADALAAYRAFLAVASRQEPRRAETEGKVKELAARGSQ